MSGHRETSFNRLLLHLSLHSALAATTLPSCPAGSQPETIFAVAHTRRRCAGAWGPRFARAMTTTSADAWSKQTKNIVAEGYYFHEKADIAADLVGSGRRWPRSRRACWRLVLAAQMGYVPGTLWILVGVVLAGAVQEFIVMFASVRRDGKSLGEMIKMELGPIPGSLALVGVRRHRIEFRAAGAGGNGRVRHSPPQCLLGLPADLRHSGLRALSRTRGGYPPGCAGSIPARLLCTDDGPPIRQQGTRCC